MTVNVTDTSEAYDANRYNEIPAEKAVQKSPRKNNSHGFRSKVLNLTRCSRTIGSHVPCGFLNVMNGGRGGLGFGWVNIALAWCFAVRVTNEVCQKAFSPLISFESWRNGTKNASERRQWMVRNPNKRLA